MSKLFTFDELTTMASTFDSRLYKPPTTKELNNIVIQYEMVWNKQNMIIIAKKYFKF